MVLRRPSIGGAWIDEGKEIALRPDLIAITNIETPPARPFSRKVKATATTASPPHPVPLRGRFAQLRTTHPTTLHSILRGRIAGGVNLNLERSSGLMGGPGGSLAGEGERRWRIDSKSSLTI